MTARAVAIRMYAGIRPEPVLIVEPRWWSPAELCKDSRFKMSNETGSYYDWGATLTVEEFRELHERYRSDLKGGLYATSGWRAVIDPMVQVIDGALAGGVGTISHIEVTVFEWESGLG